MSEDKFDAEAKAITEFVHICIECQTLFANKNFQYGNAIEDTGVIGAITTLIGDVARFRRLLFAKIAGNEAILWSKIREVLVDCHNYSTIAIMMIDKKNYYGRDQNESKRNI